MKLKFSKMIFTFLAVTILSMCMLSGCGAKKEKVLIYTSIEDYPIEIMNKLLKEKFPNYNITIEYFSTGNHAAKLLAEGTKTECDITVDLEYSYLERLTKEGILADLSSYDFSVYEPDTILNKNVIPLHRSSGTIILNTKVLEEKGLPEPKSYEDLLKSEYKGLISMPNPKASSTGYMFLKSLVNAWGEEKAFAYFDKLTPNVLQYTSSGSGPINAIVQGEVAIGLGMTNQAVIELSKGQPIKTVFFEEGSPYAVYGQAIIKGKEERKAVREVFDVLINNYISELSKSYYPEKIFVDKYFEIENYPQNIKYSDMSNNSTEEKERLLEKWKY